MTIVEVRYPCCEAECQDSCRLVDYDEWHTVLGRRWHELDCTNPACYAASPIEVIVR